MALDDRTRLAIAEIIFYVPAFIAAILVCIRQGFGRSGGFILMLILSAIRIAGSSCQIASTQESGDTIGLYIAALTLNNIGFSFMISSLLALVTRVNAGMPDGNRIPPRMLRLVNILILVGIILGIVAGTELSNFNNPDDVNSGRDKQKAAAIIFLVVIIILMAATALTFFRLGEAIPSERKLIYATALALPFLLVRLAYSIASSFDSSSSLFNYAAPNVWILAFMSVFEEFIIVIIVLTVGFVADRRKDLNLDRKDGTQLEAQQVPNNQYPPPQQRGY